MVFCVEVFGWGIMVVMGAKLLFNCYDFFYATYLAAALGHNLVPKIKQFGSWAGESNVQNDAISFSHNPFELITFFEFGFGLYSCDGSNGWNRKSLRSTSIKPGLVPVLSFFFYSVNY